MVEEEQRRRKEGMKRTKFKVVGIAGHDQRGIISVLTIKGFCEDLDGTFKMLTVKQL